MKVLGGLALAIFLVVTNLAFAGPDLSGKGQAKDAQPAPSCRDLRPFSTEWFGSHCGTNPDGCWLKKPNNDNSLSGYYWDTPKTGDICTDVKSLPN